MTNRQARALAAARKYIAAAKDNADKYARRGEVVSLTGADFFKRFGVKTPEHHDLFGSETRRRAAAERAAHETMVTPVRSAFSAGTGFLNLRPIAERVEARVGEGRKSNVGKSLRRKASRRRDRRMHGRFGKLVRS